MKNSDRKIAGDVVEKASRKRKGRKTTELDGVATVYLWFGGNVSVEWLARVATVYLWLGET